MCGIAGLLGIPTERAVVAASRMLAALCHRGPDDSGLVTVADPSGAAPPAVLVHARLAILDLSPAGHQPMADRPLREDLAPNWIVFNGEVFNFLELHDDLARAGWPCRTRCDTETILHAYRTWGETCVEWMRGMFAWCLLDAERGTAWFCRDRLGIKPLYMYRPESGGLLFASELRALLATGPDLVPPRVNRTAIECFLAQGAVWGREALVRGVTLLGPGESLVTDWSGRTLRERTYWRVPLAARPDAPRIIEGQASRGETVRRLGRTLREAVRLRLITDVPLGLFLSGGVDSGALATVATEVADTAVETLCIGFDQPEFDETEAAAAVARALGTRHRAVRLTGRMILDGLPEVLGAIDQPTIDGFNTYYVSKAAREAGLAVVLSGLGGDELFGGYPSFRDVPRSVRLRGRLRWAGRLGPALARAARWSGGRRGRKAAELFRREPSMVQMYLLRREQFLPEERRLLHPLPEGSDPLSGLPGSFAMELASRLHGDDGDAERQVSAFELTGYMGQMLLRDSDAFSMAHGLELRVPLLDHRLVEEALALPGAWKRPDPRPKPLLLDAVGGRLPRRTYTAPKRGFAFPWDAWFRGPLRAWVADALAAGDVWPALGIDPSAPAHLWARFLRKDPGVTALQVLALVVLGDYTARHGLRS